MIKEVKTTKINGLKAEDCAVLAETASRFQCDVHLIKANKKVNAKSVMGLISLNIKKGDSLYLSVSGSDEQEAINKILPLL